MDVETLVLVHQLYGAQSHYIDEGRATEWAHTFTPDGEFCSPSYPAPVTGTAELTKFAEDFAAHQGVTRHVLTNLHVTPADDGLTARAYLQIVRTLPDSPPELLRLTTITDHLVRHAGTWRIRRRTVRRDDTKENR
ncbi:nuclear transport factor 2 family protein [Amycolatopsis tucumanensis]|uniref:SnoaL-like domain-containing protein n=1 Tax=Amycolatopsis tucumanensis TaxID=401106 RepID=A0ABP7JDM4_9PSEU|nr:nuclear transport factor 2 family protein [Amycolatopsis tucumanensis]MCF6423898.1 nuclear transport factor 2 family protein [Amycolatopsis tucumanensis]